MHSNLEHFSIEHNLGQDIAEVPSFVGWAPLKVPLLTPLSMKDGVSVKFVLLAAMNPA